MIKKYLSIDWGEKRIGLAISYLTLAEPLKTLPNDAIIVKKIKFICQEYNVNTILVGLSENKSKTKTLLFIKILKKNISLPIITTDETLTTQEAKIKLLSAKKKKRNGKIDHYESCLILQNYLDSHQD